MFKCEHILEVNKDDHTYMYLDGTVAGHLCDSCAVKEGFCPFCGYFVLGSDGDYTLDRFGCCAECLEDLKYETGEYDDEPDYYDF